jgi:hypothetical protein
VRNYIGGSAYAEYRLTVYIYMYIYVCVCVYICIYQLTLPQKTFSVLAGNRILVLATVKVMISVIQKIGLTDTKNFKKLPSPDLGSRGPDPSLSSSSCHSSTSPSSGPHGALPHARAPKGHLAAIAVRGHLHVVRCPSDANLSSVRESTHGLKMMMMSNTRSSPPSS